MAIDFTASNGNPADPRSLHYVDPTGMVLNDYAKAMSGIGRVLEFYGKQDWEALFRPLLPCGGHPSRNSTLLKLFTGGCTWSVQERLCILFSAYN